MKPRSRKIIYTIIILAGFFLCLFIILLIATPRLINLEAVKKQITIQYTAETGGELEYRRLDFKFFPRPHLIISEAEFTMPDDIRGTVDSIKVFPKILPFFTGKIQIGEIDSRSPQIKIQLPAASKDKTAPRTPLSLDNLGERFNSLISTIPELNIPSMVVRVRSGRVDFLKGVQRVLGLQSVNVKIDNTGGAIAFAAECHSNFWESIVINGQYEERGLKIRSRITVNQFRPHAVADYFFPQSDLKMTNARANLTLDLQTDGPRRLQVGVNGSIPYMYWRRGNKDLKITDTSFQGGFQLRDQAVSFFIDQLELQDPSLNLGGRLDFDPKKSDIQVRLEGRQIDVPTTHKLALALTDNVGTVADIFEILRGGEFQQIQLTTHGTSWAHIADFENYNIHGNMVGGSVFIPDIEFNLENVQGEAMIANGILHGENIEARMGNSSAKQGKISIALTEDAAPFHIECLVDADLSEIPPVLTRLIENDPLKKELTLLKKIEGSAVGMLVIGEDFNDINVKVMASDIHLNADYQRIPYPVSINGGNLLLEGTQIELTNLQAGVGPSSFSGLSSKFGWGQSPSLELSSKSVKLNLTQLHAWLKQNREMEKGLKDLKKVSGSITLQNTDLRGPLFKPGLWRLRSKGDIQNLSISSDLLPGDLTVARGPLLFEGDQFKANNWDVNVGKSSLAAMSAILTWKKTATLTATSGKTVVMLDEVYTWLRSHENLKKLVNNTPPLDGSLVFQNLAFEGPITNEAGAGVKLSGEIEKWHIRSPRFPTDIELTGGDLHWRGSRIDILDTHARFGASTINRLSVGKQWGNISLFELDTDDADIQISELYPWLVSEDTLGRRFKGFKATGGKLTLNDFDLKGPVGSSGRWQLKMAGDLTELSLESDSFKAPLHINAARFSANDIPGGAGPRGHINLEPTDLSWEDSQIKLEGNASYSVDEIKLDLKLMANSLSWGQVEQITNLDKHTETGKTMQLSGSLKVESDSFTYETYAFRPLHADVTFNNTHTEIVIKKADLCGIQLPGLVKTSGDELEIYFNPAAENQSMEPVIACLSNQKNLADGNFSLEGEILSKAKTSTFPKSLTGNLELTAEQGRIYRFGILAKILALLNVTEIYRGEVPDLAGKGFAYNSMVVNGVFEDGNLIIKDTSIDSPSMGIAIEGKIDLIKKKMNLVVLVAPFKTVDRIIKIIPLIGNIMRGNLISIPFRAVGDLGDPNVIPLSPTAVGSGLLGILERTLKLPITIIQPDHSKSKDKNANETKK